MVPCLTLVDTGRQTGGHRRPRPGLVKSHVGQLDTFSFIAFQLTLNFVEHGKNGVCLFFHPPHPSPHDNTHRNNQRGWRLSTFDNPWRKTTNPIRLTMVENCGTGVQETMSSSYGPHNKGDWVWTNKCNVTWWECKWWKVQFLVNVVYSRSLAHTLELITGLAHSFHVLSCLENYRACFSFW